jgi:hypothetical protein
VSLAGEPAQVLEEEVVAMVGVGLAEKPAVMAVAGKEGSWGKMAVKLPPQREWPVPVPGWKVLPVPV